MHDPAELRAEFLEWVYEQAEGSTSTAVPGNEFLGSAGLSLPDGMALARDCKEHGLVDDHTGLARISVTLTARGIDLVHNRRRQRTEPAGRRRAVRDRLLRWLYDQDLANVRFPGTQEFRSSPLARYHGDIFSTSEVDRAAEYLAQRRLIKGTMVAERRGPVRAQITHEGQDLIEGGGSVTESLRSHQTAAPVINIGTVNNTGPMAVGSTNVSQDMTVDATAMGNFVQMLLRELPNLGLGSERENAARQALAEVHQETTAAEPDSSRVINAMSRVVGYVAEAGKPALIALFMAAAQGYGLPPV